MSDLSNQKKSSTVSGGSWPLYLDHVENWAWLENIFTPEECQTIIDFGNNLEHYEAEVVGENKKNRKSFVSWIFPNEETKWIFMRLRDAIVNLNKSYFGFDLHSFSEGLQFTRYYEPDGKYSAHIDRSNNFITRKLSISIQLNDSSEFDGGDLLFHYESIANKPEMKQGKMIAFPSYVLHEVTPVTRGTRYSLVAWISGPPFR